MSGPGLPIGFKRSRPRGLPAEPVEPHLEATLPKDVEDKRGWSFGKAVKDAAKDAWAEAFPAARRLFATLFLTRFREEMDEYVDWNPGDDEVLVEFWIPWGPLKWVPKRWRPKFRVRDLERWTEV